MWEISFHTNAFWAHHRLSVYESAEKIAGFGYDGIEICRPHLNQLLEELESGKAFSFEG